jgi:hypothetical protein
MDNFNIRDYLGESGGVPDDQTKELMTYCTYETCVDIAKHSPSLRKLIEKRVLSQIAFQAIMVTAIQKRFTANVLTHGGVEAALAALKAEVGEVELNRIHEDVEAFVNGVLAEHQGLITEVSNESIGEDDTPVWGGQ